MTIKTYAVCEDCGDAMIEYDEIQQNVSFNYENIVGEDGESQSCEHEGWEIVGKQNEFDALVVEFDYYCADCK